MDYNLETLGDGRFQKLCQALLLVSYPNAVCVPIHQPDGGRDSFTLPYPSDERGNANGIAFQVKFSPTPSVKEAREHVISLASKERAKVNALRERGFKRYVLVTNVSGTSHLDVGSIDRLNAELSEILNIDTAVWWRDDVERRIDNAPNIKWSYPEIIRGSDVLQYLLSEGSAENDSRRSNAIRSHLQTQYQADDQLKFKQVELQNKLLHLFTDVPIRMLSSGKSPKREARRTAEPRDADEHLIYRLLPDHHRGTDSPGAADILARSTGRGSLSRLVLEGAPGQGKSTITQYLCQLNRIRLLAKSSDVRHIPEAQQSLNVRLPFRVDLRDYASWISGRNPFGGQQAPLPSNYSQSLESFLSVQITSSSGGIAFDVSDLVNVLKTSHVLIVLDGFDEVADIDTRDHIVDEVTSASHRIVDHSRSAQIIVTSRPTAFSNASNFSDSDWLHLELHDLSSSLIFEYAEKWMNAKTMDERSRVEFRSTLKNRLDHDHIRDLARNPMQLAILLSLISTKGLSLPDKRTALYDAYVELFFSREAEKSVVVRDHRDLLIMMHRYIAWFLQIQAESGSGSGSIEEGQLKLLLISYLSETGHDTHLVDSLFKGMVERVVALVSRVVGTYEFEVQPLREYFCARHLYETAPYSPAGVEPRGSKPDRFQAMSANFYWLNVLRFYAGCYSTGELASIVEGLEQLDETHGYSLISQPRRLALSLLGDWVFMQQPHTARRVVNFLVHPPKVKSLVARTSDEFRGAIPRLPTQCGAPALANACWEVLRTTPHSDFILALARIISGNSPDDAILSDWRNLQGSGIPHEIWLRMIGALNIGKLISASEWKAAINSDSKIASQEFMNWGNWELLYEHPDLLERVLNDAVRGRAVPPVRSRETSFETMSDVEFAFLAFNPIILHASYQGSFTDDTLGDHISKYFLRGSTTSSRSDPVSGPAIYGKLAQFRLLLESAFRTPAADWNKSLGPWSELVEGGREIFGEGVSWVRLAINASLIRSRDDIGAGADDLLDSSLPLVSRMRYARLRTRETGWWVNQIERSDASDEYLALLALLSVCPASIIRKLTAPISEKLDSMSDEEFSSFARGFESTLVPRDLFHHWSIWKKWPLENVKGVSPRMTYIVSRRMTRNLRHLAYRWFHADAIRDPLVYEAFAQYGVAVALAGKLNWTDALQAVRLAYARTPTSLGWRRWSQDSEHEMPQAAAEEICRNPGDYPMMLVELADQTLTERVGKAVTAVGAIATEQNWQLH